MLIVVRASTVTDFGNALTGNGMLRGVEYLGHATYNMLYVGERPDPGTNIDATNVNMLSNSNLAPDAYIKLNACFAGSGGDRSIASMIANQLQRTTIAFDRGTIFSGNERRIVTNGNRPPATGPLYLIEDRGTRLVSFGP